MIPVKTKEELKFMKEGGRKLARIKKKLRKRIKAGVSPQEVDKYAEKLIKQAGGKPSFKMVKGYRWATCINVNEGVVHGVPNARKFRSGDIVSVDIGIFFKGLHTDSSFTMNVGRATDETKQFLKTGKQALKAAIKNAQPGSRISCVSQAMQKVIEGVNYSPIRELTGHGVGRHLHEEPMIPCYWDKPLGQGEIIPEGAVLAIEVIYAKGSPELTVSKKDDWTITTVDGKLSALFEETIAVEDNGPVVLTA